MSKDLIDNMDTMASQRRETAINPEQIKEEHYKHNPRWDVKRSIPFKYGDKLDSNLADIEQYK